MITEAVGDVGDVVMPRVLDGDVAVGLAPGSGINEFDGLSYRVADFLSDDPCI